MKATLSLVILASLLAGCVPNKTNATLGGPLQSGMWIARVAPLGSSFGMHGEVRLSPSPGAKDMRATLDFRALAPRARHPWIIRSGHCGETTSRDISPRAVRVLEGNLDGFAELATRVPVVLEIGETYHVAIAASVSQPDTYIACGPLLPVS